MPTAAEHQDKIEHNRDFVSFLESDSHPFQDWTIVGLYYIAVHQIERYLYAQFGKHCRDHQCRKGWTSKLTDMRSIWPDYRDLEYMSRQARYEAVEMTAADVEDAKSMLENIEKHIDSLLPSESRPRKRQN